MDYQAMSRELPKLKAALTRAKKKGPHAVVEACNTALARFDLIGWPDCWPLWERARDDAEFAIQRESGGL